MKGKVYNIKVGGDFACFSRPEFKGERVSYLVMTPSAARGILESIYWHPAFRWEIQNIKILKPIIQISILRNEIKDKQNFEPLVVEKKRAQRTSLILKNVEYVISAYMRKLPFVKEEFSKYPAQFERKLQKGQCRYTPYLGTREFAAWFEPANENEIPEQEINMELGHMLFDIAFIKDRKKNEISFIRHDEKYNPHEVKGYCQSLFFPAVVENNTLTIPKEYYNRLYELEGCNA